MASLDSILFDLYNFKHRLFYDEVNGLAMGAFVVDPTSRFSHLTDFERTRIPEYSNVTMRLQRLEKPEAWPDDLLRKLRDIPPDTFHQIPYYEPFYEKLAAFANVTPNNLIVGYGIDELIRSLMILYCQPGDSITIPWPTYGMYEVYAKIFRLNCRRVVVKTWVQLDAKFILARTTSNTKIVFLPNPGQPVETYLNTSKLIELVIGLQKRNVLLVVDEAYYHFGAATACPLIKDFDNVIILRTFSKAMGAAGLRLGYAIGSPKAIAPLQAFRTAGEATGPSMHMASVLIDHFDSHVLPSINAIREGRDWLRRTVRKDLGLKAGGHYGNHVLIDVEGSNQAHTVANHLRHYDGIYIKAEFPEPIDHCIVVTAGPRPMMESFFSRFFQYIQ